MIALKLFRKRIIITFLFCALLMPCISEDSRLGANRAEPLVTAFLKTLPLKSGQLYILTNKDTEGLIDLAAQIHINVFEVLDCTFRYIKPLNIRVQVSGSQLRSLQARYDLGGDRVLSILSVEKLNNLELGARLANGQNDLDIFLNSPSEKYIEIGTAVYDVHFGFKKMSPLLFDEAYGITVKKMFITTTLEKLELFAPGKGAIYVNALQRPKKWNLDVVTKL
jgi:hypothetical protein